MVRIDWFAYIYCYFIKELYDSLSEDGESKTLTFITREGPFLRRLFEYYQKGLPISRIRHKTAYMECSRNAVLSACEEDLKELKPLIDIKRYLHASGLTSEEIRTALLMDATEQDSFLQQVTAQSEVSLRKYLSSFCEDGRMNVADLGGRGYMQDKFSKHFGMQVKGHYLSVRASGGVPTEHKKALVYIASEQLDIFSRYAHIFNSVNNVLEELAMAGEGSVLRFALDGEGHSIRIKEWNPYQKDFYEKWISELQPRVESLTYKLMDTCHVKRERMLRKCAWKALRFAMLKNTEEVEMMRQLKYGDDTVLPGYNLLTRKKSFKDFPWSLKILSTPDSYVHFFNKFQEYMWRKWWRKPFYFLIAGMYFIYTWMVASLKPSIGLHV